MTLSQHKKCYSWIHLSNCIYNRTSLVFLSQKQPLTRDVLLAEVELISGPYLILETRCPATVCASSAWLDTDRSCHQDGPPSRPSDSLHSQG